MQHIIDEPHDIISRAIPLKLEPLIISKIFKHENLLMEQAEWISIAKSFMKFIWISLLILTNAAAFNLKMVIFMTRRMPCSLRLKSRKPMKKFKFLGGSQILF